MHEAVKHHQRAANGADGGRRDQASFEFSLSRGTRISVDRSDPIHLNLSLRGKGTSVYEATLVFEEETPVGETYVMKISWLEEEWSSEADILQEVQKKANVDELIRGHVPELVDWRDLAHSTKAIRDEIGRRCMVDNRGMLMLARYGSSSCGTSEFR